MVFYYEQKDPIYHALFVFTRTVTIFGLVVRRIEFWVFLAGHCVAMGMFRTGVWAPGELKDLHWEAVSATQMFMVFLLTFYNGHCYARFMYLYDLCMEVLDGTCFFVQEIVISMSPPSVEKHRIRAVKYVLAMLHIFFVGITGRMKKKSDWAEIVKRGLLTAVEAEQLERYPSQSIETVLVIGTWAMQIVDKGLEDDAFWHSRSMRIAHTHNRLQGYMTDILRALHEIGDAMALPIPFPYYHVMNVVLIFNLLVLCILTAAFQTYQTVFPFLVSLLFFLGLREVAASVADPFNGQDSDFPLAKFVEYAFDNSICLLEAFRNDEADRFTRKMVESTTEFTNEQLRHILPNSVLYTKGYDATLTMPFSWNKEMPLYQMTGTVQGPGHILENSRMFPEDWVVYMGGDEEENKGEKKDAKPKKKSFIKRCCGAICGLCCPKREVIHLPEDTHKAPTEMMKTEMRLLREQKENASMQEDIIHMKDHLALLKVKLEHRCSVGRELGLPVDAVVNKAYGEMRGTGPVRDKNRKPAPEFTSFDEARTIVADAKKSY